LPVLKCGVDDRVTPYIDCFEDVSPRCPDRDVGGKESGWFGCCWNGSDFVLVGDEFGGLDPPLVGDGIQFFSGISSQGAAIVRVEPFEECGG